MAIKQTQPGSRSWHSTSGALGESQAMPRLTTGQAGVTLIEMLVVVAIIAVVSSVLMFNYSSFTTNVSVRNLSQEVALSVRKAQTYATSVRVIDGVVGLNTSTFPGYGISFATSDTSGKTIPWSKQFVLFADTSSGPPYLDSTYEAGNTCGVPAVGSECIETFNINTADKVAAICKNGRANCSGYTKADITFRRPTPDAIICLHSSIIDCDVSSVAIKLLSVKGVERWVQVYNTGQISVE